MIIWDLSTIKKSWGMLDPKKIYIIKEHKETRSQRQNKYYWKVVVGPLWNHIGEQSKRSTHEYIKLEFKVETTTDLKTNEFEDLMERIRIWAAEFHGFYIPEPNEHELFKWIDKQK